MSEPGQTAFRVNLVIGRALAGLLVGHAALFYFRPPSADGWDGVALAVYAIGAVGGGLTAFMGGRRQA